MPTFFGEVGAGEDRHVVIGCQEDRKRPATSAFRQHGVHVLVDLVEIRAFFLVDLDVNKVAVHKISSFGIFEGFMRHNMAPMTS